MKLDWTATGRARTYAGTLIGTVLCIAVAFLFDSYSIDTRRWHAAETPMNNVVIPLILATPILFFLLDRQRELAIAHRELMNVASTDSLTNLLNRRAFTTMVEEYLSRVEESSVPSDGALLVVDVDHFKTVNDSYGHEYGDEALKLIARSISDTVRDTDLVGRIGGEEFGVFLPGQSPERISNVAERIRVAVDDAEFIANGQPHHLTVSVGGVTYNQSPVSFSELFRDADERLYRAKRNGRNRVELSSFGQQRQPALLH